jgi:hypothetical protein
MKERCAICDIPLESIYVERSDSYPALCKECEEEFEEESIEKTWRC